MPIAPEVSFHRYFQNLYPADRQCYKGRQNLEKLQAPEFQDLLAAIQEALNEGFAEEQPNPHHVPHPPFHVDYVDSSISNAMAFQYDGYSFVGITVPLIYAIWYACDSLSNSPEVAALLSLDVAAADTEPLRVALFRIILLFVAIHEYTHHVHGHLTERIPPNEIEEDGRPGSLTVQVHEMDADAYATFFVMANLITGFTRPFAVELLKLKALRCEVQDQVLFSSIVLAIGAYFLLRPPPILDNVRIYTLTHPPQAVRMRGVMTQAIRWCKKNRPVLEEYMTTDRFQTLMAAAANVIWAQSDLVRASWASQVLFLKSSDGVEYQRQLDMGLQSYISSLKVQSVTSGFLPR